MKYLQRLKKEIERINFKNYYLFGDELDLIIPEQKPVREFYISDFSFSFNHDETIKLSNTEILDVLVLYGDCKKIIEIYKRIDVNLFQFVSDSILKYKRFSLFRNKEFYDILKTKTKRQSIPYNLAFILDDMITGILLKQHNPKILHKYWPDDVKLTDFHIKEMIRNGNLRMVISFWEAGLISQKCSKEEIEEEMRIVEQNYSRPFDGILYPWKQVIAFLMLCGYKTHRPKNKSYYYPGENLLQRAELSIGGGVISSYDSYEEQFRRMYQTT